MKQENTIHVKQKWGGELELEIGDELTSEIHRVTNANLWREFQWNIVNRFFRTPYILSKTDPGQTSACWRKCGEDSANHANIFWRYPLLDTFWREVFDSLDKIFGFQLPRVPFLAILGVNPTYVRWQSVLKGIYTKNNLHAETAKCTIHRPTVTFVRSDAGARHAGETFVFL